jgi:hypothetical protein
MSVVRFSGQVGRYLSGLCVATLGLCAAGWLALAPVAFGYRSAGRPGTSLPSAGLQRAAWTDWVTAAGLAVVSLVTLACWIAAWRRRLRADGILVRASRRQARRESRVQRRRQRDDETAVRTPDPAQVLSELRTLLTTLLAEPADGQAGRGANGHPDREYADREYADRGHDEPGYHGAPGESGEEDHQPEVPVVPVIPHPRAGGLAAMESMLAGAELLMVGCGEEEAW